MIRAFILCVLLMCSSPVVAQTLNARAATLLEDQLSGDGRSVTVEGFSGAVSTRAAIERLTIADEQGVWLVLEDAVLDWTASALLKRRLQIEELSAARLEIRRLPVAQSDSMPSSEASGVRMPELPVAIGIGRLSVPDIRLGSSVLGEAVVATISASAVLEAGGLDVTLNAERIDGAGGTAEITAKFDPNNDVLTLIADLQEPGSGVVARALALPGLPSVRLQINGQGPLGGFSTDILLATDGQERLGGVVELAQSGADGRRFTADISGDVRPLLTQENKAFFGDNTAFAADGIAGADGSFTLDQLHLKTAQLDLQGNAKILAGGEPESFALTGRTQGQIPGTDVSTGSALLTLVFDAARGPDWTFGFIADQVALPDTEIAQLKLQGQGVLTPGGEVPFAGNIEARANGVSLADADLQSALGTFFRAQTQIEVQSDLTIILSDLDAATQHATLTGRARAAPTDGRLAISGAVTAFVPNLTDLGPLVQPLQAGSIRADATVEGEFPGGAINVELTGVSNRLDIGQAALKPLLEPRTDLSVIMRRDEAGTVLEQFDLRNEQIKVTGSGQLSEADGQIVFDAELTNAAVLVTDLPEGALTLSATASDLQTAPNMVAELSHASGSSGNVRATLSGTNLSFDAHVDAPRLAPFADLIAPLKSGEASVKVVGTAQTDTGEVALKVTGRSQALDIGVPKVAALLTPETQLNIDVIRAADGDVTLKRALLTNPELSVDASGTVLGDARAVTLAAVLRDVAVLEPNVTGRLSVNAQVDGDDITAQLEHASGATGDLRATLEDAKIAFDAMLDVPRFSPFAKLTAPLRAGEATVKVVGVAKTDTGAVTANISGRSRALDVGIPIAAPLLSPETQVQADVSRDADGVLTVNRAVVSNQELNMQASGVVSSDTQNLTLSAVLTDLSRLVPNVPGRLALEATLNGDRITAQLDSATGAEAQINGRIGLPNGAVDIAATGRAPLGLAGPFIGQRVLTGGSSFDLTLRGAPGISALSGQITTSDMRFADPALGFVLNPAQAQIQLGQSVARINLNGALNDAPLDVSGTLGLAAPYNTDLAVQLRDLAYVYEDIARVQVGASLTLQGPAQRQLALSGDVRIGDAEIRVPDTGLGSADPVPLIRHLNAPRDVRQTLSRANLLGGQQASGGGIRLPLNITITATEPVFVRGRGLDAEFGGALQLNGTAANPIPIGRFDLRRGRLSFLGQRLDLSEGAITAAGSLIPRLRIVAEAVAEDVTAQIILEGPADAPELTLTSEPELPQDEILARVLFGEDVASLSAFQIARLISSLATLSSGKPGLLDNTRLLFGVDDLDIRTDATTGEAELAIGQYISDNIYSEIELGAGGDTQINLNLDLTDTTRLRGSVNSDGGTGIGIFWEKDY
ncbi:MAG: translocation/assembly module TamB domain-containing protein [Aliishimia sp.]